MCTHTYNSKMLDNYQRDFSLTQIKHWLFIDFQVVIKKLHQQRKKNTKKSIAE